MNDETINKIDKLYKEFLPSLLLLLDKIKEEAYLEGWDDHCAGRSIKYFTPIILKKEE
jgi:hypothetical protein